jgi:aconitate hydratase
MSRFECLDDLGAGTSSRPVFQSDVSWIRAIGGVHALPISLKLLLENLIRHCDGKVVTDDALEAFVGGGSQKRTASPEVPFHPSYVLMHDTTGRLPWSIWRHCGDVAALHGIDPKRVSPRIPVHVSVDHSLAVEAYGRDDAIAENLKREYGKNREPLCLLSLGGDALQGSRSTPRARDLPSAEPWSRINRVVRVERRDGAFLAVPDSLVGMDQPYADDQMRLGSSAGASAF